jgi:hypothetical protein
MAVLIKIYRIPASISDSFYRPGIGYVFTIWCYVIGLGMCALMAELSAGTWYQFLSLFAAGGLLFVGAAPHFRTHERTIHYCAAGTCAVAALTWMCAAGWWYIPIPLLVISGGLTWVWRRRKMVFWVECALFTSMFVVTGIKILGGG